MAFDGFMSPITASKRLKRLLQLPAQYGKKEKVPSRDPDSGSIYLMGHLWPRP